MPRTVVRAALGVMLLVLIGAAACGSNDEPLAEDEYLEQADEICRVSATALGEIPDPQGVKDIGPAFSQALPIVETLADDLEELNAPDEFATQHEEVIALLREQNQIGADAVARIEEGEPVSTIVDEISPRLQQIEDEATATATELGLTVCGRDS